MTSDPLPLPQSKADRNRERWRKFIHMLTLNIRQHASRIDRLDVQVRAQQDAIDDLRNQLTRVAQRAEASVRMYYDTHDLTTGEHVGGGVFDQTTAVYVEPSTQPRVGPGSGYYEKLRPPLAQPDEER